METPKDNHENTNSKPSILIICIFFSYVGYIAVFYCATEIVQSNYDDILFRGRGLAPLSTKLTPYHQAQSISPLCIHMFSILLHAVCVPEYNSGEDTVYLHFKDSHKSDTEIK